MDEAGYRSLVRAHARFPLVARELVRELDTILLRQREAEGRWSPLEIMVHLRDEEMEDFRPRAQAASQGRSDVDPIDPVGWVQERDYNAQDPGAILESFAAERALSCDWLEGLELASLAHGAEFGPLGRMRCGDFIAAWRMHDLLHLRQLATALAHLTARGLEGWAVAYAGRMPDPEVAS